MLECRYAESDYQKDNQIANDTKTSITLTLTQAELFELQRILLDEDREDALRFLKSYLDKAVKAAVFGQGH